jgi:hypothetical protein
MGHLLWQLVYCLEISTFSKTLWNGREVETVLIPWRKAFTLWTLIIMNTATPYEEIHMLHAQSILIRGNMEGTVLREDWVLVISRLWSCSEEKNAIQFWKWTFVNQLKVFEFNRWVTYPCSNNKDARIMELPYMECNTEIVVKTDVLRKPTSITSCCHSTVW